VPEPPPADLRPDEVEFANRFLTKRGWIIVKGVNGWGLARTF
jgi:hypothetical protein